MLQSSIHAFLKEIIIPNKVNTLSSYDCFIREYWSFHINCSKLVRAWDQLLRLCTYAIQTVGTSQTGWCVGMHILVGIEKLFVMSNILDKTVWDIKHFKWDHFKSDQNNRCLAYVSDLHYNKMDHGSQV